MMSKLTPNDGLVDEPRRGSEWTPAEIGQFYELLHPDGPDGLIAVLVAYIDESSSQNPQTVYVVGGYVASPKQWMEFSRSWNRILRDAKIKPPDSGGPPVFHMSEFEHREHIPNSPYAHISKEAGYVLLQKLIRLINRLTRFGSVQGLASEHHKAFFAEFIGGMSPTFADPYIPSLLACLYWLNKYRIRLAPSQTIACIFEQNDQVKGRIERFHAEAASSWFPGTFVEDVAFQPKQRAPLQAADMLAYESMKHIKNRMLQGETFPKRKTFELLENHPNLHGGFCDEEWLRSVYSRSREKFEAEMLRRGPA